MIACGHLGFSQVLLLVHDICLSIFNFVLFCDITDQLKTIVFHYFCNKTTLYFQWLNFLNELLVLLQCFTVSTSMELDKTDLGSVEPGA